MVSLRASHLDRREGTDPAWSVTQSQPEGARVSQKIGRGR